MLGDVLRGDLGEGLLRLPLGGDRTDGGAASRDRIDAFLLPSGTLRPKAQIANPEPAADKKPGKLFLMDNTIPTPNAEPTLRPTR